MNRLLMATVAAGALWAGACSNGGSNIAPPPPSGKYGNSSLNGTYAFVTVGETIVNTINGPAAASLARTGSFTANGSGAITAGVYDLVVSGVSSTTSSAPIPITGGTYSVNADGRGTLLLNVTSSGGPATIAFAIVFTSTSAGFMMDETASGNQASTGSGNFALQNTAAFAAGVTGSYVFDFTGFDVNANPESLVGQFAANGGVITSGVEDVNDGTSLSSGSIAGQGTFAMDPANSAAGRGLATIEGQTYAFYVVDSTRVRFISIDSSGAPMLTGDAVAQSGPAPPPAPSGSFVFLVAGSSANGGLIRLGRFTISGSALSNIVMDVNSGGSENPFGSGSLTNSSITYDATTGRGMVSFQSSTVNVYSFVFYLSSPGGGVIQEVSPDDTTPAFAVADGSIAAQSGNPFSSSNISGTYAMSWSGLVTAGGNLGSTDEEDLLSQVSVSNLNLSGTSDIFQFTGVTLNTDIGTGGQIALNGDGTANNTMSVNLSQISAIHMVVYVVNPQLAFFMSGNNNTTRVVAGVLEAQQ